MPGNVDVGGGSDLYIKLNNRLNPQDRRAIYRDKQAQPGDTITITFPQGATFPSSTTAKVTLQHGDCVKIDW